MQNSLNGEQQRELIRLARAVVNGVEFFKFISDTSPDYKELRDYLERIDPPPPAEEDQTFAAYVRRRRDESK